MDRIWRIVPDEEDNVGSVISEADSPEYSRNEASVRLKMQAVPLPRLRFVGDIEAVWLNRSDRVLELAELTLRDGVDPWRLEAHAAYVDLYDVVPGLDIRIGRQKVQWGSADLLNPTDNLNPDDLEDQLLLGDNIATEMIRLDYTILPERLDWLEEVSFSLVWVPVFRPAQLPVTANLKPLQNDPLQVIEDDIRESSENTRGMFEQYLYDPTVHIEVPRFSLSNSQLGLRVLARMMGTDFTLSYYRGFDDIPVISEVANVLDDDGEHMHTDVTMRFPRMQVLGFDINGQIAALGHMGFWFEGAVIWPERLPFVLTTEMGPLTPQGPIVSEGTAIDDRPFFKFTLGFDHSLGEHVFIDVQWVHGFIDDFGVNNLNNFLVAGFDLKLWSERILIRCFALLQLDWIPEAFQGRPYEEWRDGLSASIRPTFRIVPWSSVELELGAMIPFGGRGAYFERPRSGSTTVFFRVRASI